MTLFDEQHEVDGDVILFQCTECGQIELSLGALHAHIESHRGCTRWNIQVPFTKTAMANWEELMARTEVLRVRRLEQITLDDVPELAGRESLITRLSDRLQSSEVSE